MKSSRTFTPTVADSLETRCVPAFLGAFTVAQHAIVVPHAVVTHPKPPGTFTQGSNPAFTTLPNGEMLTLNSRLTTSRLQTSSTSPTRAAAVVTPSAVVTHPVAPGTFRQGDLPPFFTAPNGEMFTLNRFRF